MPDKLRLCDTEYSVTTSIAMQGWYLDMWQPPVAARLAGPAAALEADDACTRSPVPAALWLLACQQQQAPAHQSNQDAQHISQPKDGVCDSSAP